MTICYHKSMERHPLEQQSQRDSNPNDLSWNSLPQILSFCPLGTDLEEVLLGQRVHTIGYPFGHISTSLSAMVGSVPNFNAVLVFEFSHIFSDIRHGPLLSRWPT